MCSICALDLKFTLNLTDVRVYTFGSPRVGNNIFAEFFEANVQVRATAAQAPDSKILQLSPCLVRRVAQSQMPDPRSCTAPPCEIPSASRIRLIRVPLYRFEMRVKGSSLQ